MSEITKLVLWVGGTLIVACIAVPLAAFPPIQGKPIAVLIPPWMDRSQAMQAVRDAGGDVLDFTGSALIALGEEPKFFSQLRDRGTFVLLNAEDLAALCGAGPNQTSRDQTLAKDV